VVHDALVEWQGTRRQISQKVAEEKQQWAVVSTAEVSWLQYSSTGSGGSSRAHYALPVMRCVPLCREQVSPSHSPHFYHSHYTVITLSLHCQQFNNTFAAIYRSCRLSLVGSVFTDFLVYFHSGQLHINYYKF